MAHNLMIKNGKAQMMYVGQPPWHGLGTKLDRPATAVEAIQAAGLDWKVRKVPLWACEGTNNAKVLRYEAVVPESRWGLQDCPVFGVVGTDYHPLQNAEAFAFFDSIVGHGAAVYHTAGALGEGEQVWILAKLPGMIEVTASDGLEKYVLLSTGHDGRTCLRMILTPVRVVCQNTLTLALQSGEEVTRAYHTRDMERQLTGVQLKVRALLAGFEDIQEACRAMARKPLDQHGMAEYVAEVFPHPDPLPANGKVPAWITEDRANCTLLFHEGLGNAAADVKGTLWAAYNGVTEYVDHWRERGDGQHMRNVCFGRGYQIKARAYSVACRLARIGNAGA